MSLKEKLMEVIHSEKQRKRWEKVKYLSRVTFFSIQKLTIEKKEKIIICIGETHSENSAKSGGCGNCELPECYDVVDWLVDWINDIRETHKKDKSFRMDLFVETPYLPRKTSYKQMQYTKHEWAKEQLTPMIEIPQRFPNCFIPYHLTQHKRKCKYRESGVRFHYVDIRMGCSFLGEGGCRLHFEFLALLSGIIESFRTQHDPDDQSIVLRFLETLENKNIFQDYLAILMNSKWDESRFDTLIDQFMSSYRLIETKHPDLFPKITKYQENQWKHRMQKVHKEVYQVEDKEFFKQLQSQFGGKISDLLAEIRTLLLDPNERTDSFLRDLSYDFLLLSSFVMDWYTLSRMFHPQLNDSNVLIFVGGKKHAQHYQGFFARQRKARSLYLEAYYGGGCIYVNDY
jgi:hypothetical protein